MPEDSLIRDLSLAPAGEKKIAWAEAHMPVLSSLAERFTRDLPLKGKKVAMCLHLEAKTAVLARTVQASGAQVAVVASNPLSTQDDVVAALVRGGVAAYAWYGATGEEYQQHLHNAIDFEPELLVDDGCDLVALLHGPRREQLSRVIGGAEETTTGVLRLRAMAREKVLAFPMIAVNDAQCKHLFDNRYGTGQSVWDGINRTTNLVVAGKTSVVVGYGWCGKGVAMRARGLGSRVIVCEVDPIRANEALMDGYDVMPIIDALQRADFVITVTGNQGVVNRQHLEAIKDGAVLANAGHFDVEISKNALSSLSRTTKEMKNNITCYEYQDGRKVYLLADGRLVNLAAGDGHPVEIMDMSFAAQVLSLEYLVNNASQLGPGVWPFPHELDLLIASLRLESLGVAIDKLTEDQEEYLGSWNR